MPFMPGGCLTMNLRLKLALLLLIAFASSVYGQYACTGNQNTAGCPPCYYNQSTPTFHGTTADGRRRVNVFIQGGTSSESWDDPPGSANTNTQIWDAVRDGRALWNNATDTTSNPGTTNRPPHIFEEAQGGGTSNADVIVVRDTSVPFARTDVNTAPPIIRINPTRAA